MGIRTIGFSIAIVFCGTITTATAQEKNEGMDTMVNEQFGTLLESLLTDGKISETGARNYLETVFGHDEQLGAYLESFDLSRQLSAANTSNLSLGDKVMNLNTTLLGIIPEEYKKNLMQNPNYLGWQLGHEMNNGGITAETLQNTFSFFAEGIRKDRENKQIVEKLKVLTPKADKLRASNTPKKTVVNNAANTQNWKLNPLKIKKGFFSDASTFNQVTIESGNLILDPTERYNDKPLNIYKNKEKFDFSKDFKMTIKGKVAPTEWGKLRYLASGFTVMIGQYYKFEIGLTHYEKYKDLVDCSLFSISVPDANFTPNYGVFFYEPMMAKSQKDNLRQFMSKRDKKYEKAYKLENIIESPALDVKDGFELVIQSKDGKFTFLINGIDCTIEKEITYFPNKYSLDITASFTSIIESVVLEHL